MTCKYAKYIVSSLNFCFCLTLNGICYSSLEPQKVTEIAEVKGTEPEYNLYGFFGKSPSVIEREKRVSLWIRRSFLSGYAGYGCHFNNKVDLEWRWAWLNLPLQQKYLKKSAIKLCKTNSYVSYLHNKKLNPTNLKIN